MVVVDSSVWIDFFNGKPGRATDTLRELLPRERLLVGDLILCEVLSGFRSEADFDAARQLLAALEYADMVGPEVALAAADNYRALRRKGVTARKMVDVLIASFCVLNQHHLLHHDRDFDAMAAHIGLRTL